MIINMIILLSLIWLLLKLYYLFYSILNKYFLEGIVKGGGGGEEIQIK